MATAIVTVGAVFSGKTRFAEQIVERDPSYVIISRDDFRNKLYPKGHKFTMEDETYITSKQYDMIRECYNNNDNIIITNSNLRMSHLRSFIRILERYDYDVKLKFCETSEDEIQLRSKECGVILKQGHIQQQKYLYSLIKEKIESDSRYNKYLML